MTRICLLTPGQPSTNPRLVKEADALAEAGFKVHVVYAHWADWAEETDRELLASRSWTWTRVGGDPKRQRLRYFGTSLRHGLSRRAFPAADGSRLVQQWALSRVAPELESAAKSIRADLYIGHNLAALPAAVAGALHNGAQAGFDAEDFHSAMVPQQERSCEHILAEKIERRFLPRCAYVTAAADGIAEAYAEKYGIALPETILNVFALRERPRTFRAAHPDAPLTLYWFSQTIGRGRGLEDAVRAIGILQDRRAQLHLLGTWALGYESELFQLAESAGVAPAQIHHHTPAPPEGMIELAAQHNIGLALEEPGCLSRDICITNKVFTYLLAGNAIAATATHGQQAIISRIGRAGFCYESGNAAQLAESLRRWNENRASLDAARREAWEWGSRQYNWDLEKQKFLQVVERALERHPRRMATV